MACSSALYLPEGRVTKNILLWWPPRCHRAAAAHLAAPRTLHIPVLILSWILVCCQRNVPKVGTAAASWLSDRRIFPGENDHLLSFSKMHLFFLNRSTTVPWGSSYSTLWKQDNIPYIFLQRNRFKYVQWKFSTNFRDNPQLALAPVGPVVSCVQYTQTSLDLNVKVSCFSFNETILGLYHSIFQASCQTDRKVDFSLAY